MKEPSDFKDSETSQRIKIREQNRKRIEAYFNNNIFSSEGGIFEINGRTDKQAKEDYSEFLKEWLWESEFHEREGSSWSMTTKSEVSYTVTVVTVKPMEKK